mgnify:CR=1 FL=1
MIIDFHTHIFPDKIASSTIKKLEESPDLVLLDIMLPGKDGYEISQKFIEKNIPIIFLTAKDSTLDKVTGLKLGAEDYITKPFSTKELILRVNNLIKRVYKEKLENKLGIPVYLEDERLTTKQAENILINNDTSRKKRKKVIDSMAATIILQSYLDKNK